MAPRLDKKTQKKIAEKRINYLMELAEKKGFENLRYSDRYVEIARKISMKYLVPIPKKYKRRICKKCYCYMHPETRSRTRIKNGKIVIYCKKCKNFNRFPIK